MTTPLNVIGALVLIIISVACLLNWTHAEDYKPSWKRNLLFNSAFAVLAFPDVSQGQFSFWLLCFICSVTWQNVSMSIHSRQRHTRSMRVIR